MDCVQKGCAILASELQLTDANMKGNLREKRLSGLLPPSTRRAVTLIDPSYELKVTTTMSLPPCKAHKRFANGTYLPWYPVITRQRVTTLLRDLQKQSGILIFCNWNCAASADHDGLGMTGSGLFIINPLTLAQQMRALLPATTTVSVKLISITPSAKSLPKNLASTTMAYWLMKSELTFSASATRPRTHRDVRNYQARNMLWDQMQVDDLAFLSFNCDVRKHCWHYCSYCASRLTVNGDESRIIYYDPKQVLKR